MTDLPLAAEFPAATREQWLKLVEGVLKGADFEKRLVARSHDGLSIQPLYPKAEGAARIVRGEAGPWRVVQRVDHPEATVASELALRDLEGGADALSLVFAGAPSARGFGLTAGTVEDLDRALGGVMLDLVHLRLDAGSRGRHAAALLVALAESRGHRVADLSLDLALDPIGAMSAGGVLSAPWEVVGARCAQTLDDCLARGIARGVFLADGRPASEAGASEAQELAVVLATGLAYLRALEAGGHGLDAARNALSFLLVADADEFLTVAKFRALRRLWARVEEACGLAPKPLRLHAETAWRMTARRDPWVNLLRGTIAAFSAGIGGADTLLVQPFTAALGLPDAFARRVARNTQHILLEESNLWRVADPAAGAGGFEALTDELCGTAWALFQEIEREGGVVASLTAGALQARIAAVRERRERAVATRKDPITGVSEFPNIHEAPVGVLMPHAPEVEAPEPGPGAPAGAAPVTAFSSLVDALANGATTGDIAAASGAAPLRLVSLPSSRNAEPFERLRDRSDDHLARTGERPKVFLANLGPIAAFTARATFAKNFFEAGGIEAITNDGFEDVDALVNACSGSKARLFCVCSSDEIYKERAEEVILGLRNVSKSPIYIACRPGELEEKIRRAGATTFIFAGCDALTVLGEALSAASA